MFIAMLAAAAATAAAPEPVRQVRVTDAAASYVRSEAADGTVTFRGQDQDTGQMFRLTVAKDGFVRGWFGTQAIKFRLSEAQVAAP